MELRFFANKRRNSSQTRRVGFWVVRQWILKTPSSIPIFSITHKSLCGDWLGPSKIYFLVISTWKNQVIPSSSCPFFLTAQKTKKTWNWFVLYPDLGIHDFSGLKVSFPRKRKAEAHGRVGPERNQATRPGATALRRFGHLTGQSSPRYWSIFPCESWIKNGK